MTNRKLSSPILSAVVVAFAAGLPLVGHGQTQVSNAGYSTPAAQSGPAPVTPTAAAASAKHTITYTAVKGDSLTSIARKFNTTRKKLRDLNSIVANTVIIKAGDVLLVPAPFVSRAAAAAATAKARRELAMAQPVQDFDVPASTFASCPVPLPTPGDDPTPAAAPATDTDSTGKPAPIAKLVSPAEMAADPGPEVEIITPTTPRPAPVPTPTPAPVPQIALAEVAPSAPKPILATPSSASKYNTSSTRPAPITSTGATTASVRPVPAPFNPPAPRLTSRGVNPGANPSLNSNPASMQAASAGDWGSRFFQQARALGNEGIEYDDDWRPPGESHSWVMDCSNTSRYLYKVTAGLELPRTASDQYYYLHLQGKAWDAPLNSQGFVDTEYLRRNLKPGDLLFWENTYRPERQPPITHVMVYLGTNDKGQWIMAGSQSSRGGEHNRRNGGPDIYVFRPSQPCGGYTTWLGMVRHQGRFCAFGRPLEADPTKLSVAANE